MAAAKSAFQKLLLTGQKNVKKFAQEAKKKGGGAPVDDGDYTAQFTSVSIGNNNPGTDEERNWILRGWTVLEDTKYDGKNVGFIMRQFANLNDEEDLKFVMSAHAKLGCDPEEDDYDIGSPEKLLAIEESLIPVPTIAKIRAKTKVASNGNEYQNFYILSLVENYEGRLATDPEEDDEDVFAEEEAPKPKSKAKAAPVEEDDEEEETPAPKAKAKAKPAPVEEDDEEEEEPAPKKKGTAKAAPVEEEEEGVKIGDTVHWTDEESETNLEGTITEILKDKKGEDYAIKVLVPKKGMRKAKTWEVSLEDETLDAGPWPDEDEE